MMPEAPSTPIDSYEPEPGWEWRKARNAGIEIAFWPIQWHLGVRVSSDKYCWVGALDLGPFVFTLNVNNGM